MAHLPGLAAVRAQGPDLGRAVPIRQEEQSAIGQEEHARDAVDADLAFEDVQANQYDAIVLPGGQINPDILRVNDVAMTIISTFVDAGKPTAAICHAPWLLIEAGAVSGREVTSYPSIKTDMVNAGGRWMDETVVSDRGIITSRNPGDLDAFVQKIIEEVATAEHGTRAA